MNDQAPTIDEKAVAADVRLHLVRAFAIALDVPTTATYDEKALVDLEQHLASVTDARLKEMVLPECMQWRHRLRDNGYRREQLHQEITARIAMAREATAEAARRWDAELDALGTDAPVKILQRHLAHAPEGTDQAGYLAGFIAGRLL